MISLRKAPFLLFLFTLICISSIAQQLPQINYQGVARKADGSPVAEQSIKLKLTILDGSATGSNVYSETRQVTTNKFGLFTIVIGSSGAVSQSGTLTAVNWATGNKFLQVEIDAQGGNNFINMGSSQLQTVPYAIHAISASPSGNAGGDLGGIFPNPAVTKLQGFPLSNVAPANGQILKWNGSAWIPSDVVSATGTTITGASPIISVMQGASANISISQADAATDGYLSKTDWQGFKDKATTIYVDAAVSANSVALAAETTRATAAESLKENSNNKSTDGSLVSNSDLKFPTEKATKTYVDAAINANATPDASLTTKGKVQLAGDLSGTPDIPVIGDGRITTAKILDGNVTDSKIATGISASKVGLANVDNTSDLSKPISVATQSALDFKASAADVALKAPLASPTFTGTVSGITATMVGLSNVDNTADLLKPISTATQTALDLKAPLASPTFTGTVAGISKSMVGLANVDNTTDLLKPISTATQIALDAKSSNTDLALKAPLASPTFTGIVSGITAAMVGLGNADNTTDLLKPISTASQTALDLKAPLASPTFTGTVAGISKSMVGLANVDNTTDLLKPISTATQTALDAKSSNTDLALKAPLASPTFTGTVSGITAAMVGLGNADNTTDLLKPLSTATQTALDLKAPLASPTFTGTVAGISKSMVGLANVDNTTDLLKPISTATQTALDAKAGTMDLALKAPLASPTFTGTVAGISKSMVGLANVDNTTDLLKPISTATQTALDAKAGNTDLALKAPLASPTFTGTVAGISKSMVGLSNVDNTTDLLKPISTATQIALDAKAGTTDIALKAPLASPTFTGTVSGITAAMVGLGSADNTSDANKPVSIATQTAIDAKANNTDLAIKAPLASPTFTGTVAGISKSMVGLGNVDNTTDLLKPVSTATQTALDLKAPLASPTFTGTVSGITAIMVGLSNVNNTTDLLKPISTATQTALDLKANSASIVTGLDGLTDSKVGGANFLNSLLLGHQLTGALNNAERNIGISGLVSVTEGDDNIAIGTQTLNNTTTGSNNTVIGTGAVYYNTSNSYITAVGKSALHAEQGGGNTALGYNAGSRGPIASTLTNSTFLGNSASAGSGTIDNATAIGSGASVDASNTIQLGNTSVTSVKTSGTITAGTITYPKTDGVSGQALITNGSGTLGWGAAGTIVREVTDEVTATSSQASFTLTQTPSANSKVKMFVNGIRISNTAYSYTGAALTYNATNNGNYAFSSGDRIQFDYFY